MGPNQSFFTSFLLTILTDVLLEEAFLVEFLILDSSFVGSLPLENSISDGWLARANRQQ